MPRINWNEVEEPEDFSPVPADRYTVEVEDIDSTKTTGNGDEMWSLKLNIIDGEHAGRKIFDNMVFSAAALKRAKLICSRMGINTTTEMDLEPEMLVGQQCMVDVEIEEYEDAEGKPKKRNKIPFAGYYRIEDEGAADSVPVKPAAPSATAKNGKKAKGKLPF